jgi:midasin (ATPase involved in ribosome maturation)
LNALLVEPSGCGETDKAFLITSTMERKVIFRNLQWHVNDEGDIICNDHVYEICRTTLDGVDWISHMQRKSWCNLYYFKQALDFSLKNT